MSYIKKDFLLTTKTANNLYYGYAKDMPIFDYHCHLPEKQILENKPFGDLFEIWLAGDHYFRRILCDYLGGMIERGEMTADMTVVGKVIKDICFNNAVEYFGM